MPPWFSGPASRRSLREQTAAWSLSLFRCDGPWRRTRIFRTSFNKAPELAHSVHIELEGLEPGRRYWYRFGTASHTSRVGRFKTLPGAHASIDSLRFVTASCQNYTHGTFVAYEHILRDQPDFIIPLGDYFYETSYGETFRLHEVEPSGRMPSCRFSR